MSRDTRCARYYAATAEPPLSQPGELITYFDGTTFLESKNGSPYGPVGSGAGDVLVAVTGADTTPSYLGNKLVGGANVTLTLLNPGANEQIEIAAAAGGGGGWTDDGAIVRLTTAADNVIIGADSPIVAGEKLRVVGTTRAEGDIVFPNQSTDLVMEDAALGNNSAPLGVLTGGGGDDNGGGGGWGGDYNVQCGNGGDGSAGQPAGSGGNVNFLGGDAGADNGGGGNFGGGVAFDVGISSGGNPNGEIAIGDSNASEIRIGLGGANNKIGSTAGGTTQILFPLNAAMPFMAGTTGNRDYFKARTSTGDAAVELANTVDNPDIRIHGTGQVQFDALVPDIIITPLQQTTPITGRKMSIFGGQGGDASGASPGGVGGGVSAEAGPGGDGSLTQPAGAGAVARLLGGGAGADGGAGGAIGGNAEVVAGPGSGAFGAGAVRLGATRAAQVVIGNALMTSGLQMLLADDLVAAATIGEGATVYQQFDTDNGNEAIIFSPGGAPTITLDDTGDIVADKDGSTFEVYVADETDPGGAGRSMGIYAGGGGNGSGATPGGNGAPMFISAGGGGNGTASAAAGHGGSMNIDTGGAGNNAGGGPDVGGDYNITLGRGSTNTGGAIGGQGGTYNLLGGPGGGGGAGQDGPGAPVNITGGHSGTGGASGNVGGPVNIAGGDGTTQGAAVNVTGGDGVNAAGDVNVTGGEATSAQGGSVVLNGGPDNGGGAGDILIGSTDCDTLFLLGSGTQTLSYFGSGGATQQTITGSRGGNAALADLLTKLASYGIIIDSTSA